jgi:hypothetical protein
MSDNKEQFSVGNVAGGIGGGLTGGLTNILVPGGLTGGLTNILVPGGLFTSLFGNLLPDMSGLGQICSIIVCVIIIICMAVGAFIYVTKK